MKYSVNNYVEAFVETLAASDKKDQVITNFIKLLKKTGDIKHSKKIFEAIHKKLVNSDGGKWVDIDTARELSEAKLKPLISKFSKKDHINLNINKGLIAGVRVTVNGEDELDNSLNKKLNKLFK